MDVLTNAVKDYPWGSATAIPELLGRPASGEPQAELWLGAHGAAPSRLADGTGLDDAVAADPARWLGDVVRQRFSGRLPFLLKVLAAAEPLSLQVHPSAAQAGEGFAAENAAAVSLDAPHRRYRDDSHKPEMLVALTPFDVLCGLRDPVATHERLAGLRVENPRWRELLHALQDPDARSALRRALALILVPRDDTDQLVAEVAAACAQRLLEGSPHGPQDETVTQLAQAHPGDPGVVLSLLLHRVRLAPGEAVFLPAGNLHAYLCGLGIEVMASSDNVLRAGLTGKHVDVDEVLRVADTSPVEVPWVLPRTDGRLSVYSPGAQEFELLVVDEGAGDVVVTGPGPKIVLLLSDDLRLRTATDALEPGRGDAVVVADTDGDVVLSGRGRAVVARVPAPR